MIIVFCLCAVITIIVFLDIAIEIAVDCHRHLISSFEAVFLLLLLITSTASIVISLFLLSEYV